MPSSRKSFLNSLGAVLRTVASVVLVALTPYTLFAAYWLYLAASSWTTGSVGPVVYAAARFTGCILMLYALWRLRQVGLRLRNRTSPGR